MTRLTLRPATPRDALHVALILDLAGHGIEVPVWEDQRGPDHSVLEAARLAVLDPANLFYTWRRAWLAELDGEVAGGLIGGPVAGHDVTEGLPPPLVPLVALENLVPGYWNVQGLAVLSEHRGKGIARALLRHAAGIARKTGAAGLSIVVEDTNTSAIALYESEGYRRRETRPWIGYGGRSGPGHWVMLAQPFPA